MDESCVAGWMFAFGDSYHLLAAIEDGDFGMGEMVFADVEKRPESFADKQDVLWG